MSNIKALFAAAIFISTPVTYASVITGGDLLDQNGATLIEGYLQTGSLDFTNISNLNAGATSTQWHADVRGYVDVLSIYDITYGGVNYLLGGYSAIGHDGTGWTHMTDISNRNIIFNLTTDVVRYSHGFSDMYDQYDGSDYFATFGGGHDLAGGKVTLGSPDFSYAYEKVSRGYGYSYTGPYPLLDANGNNIASFTVNGLESYAIASAIPEPSIIALMGLGLLGLGLSRRKLKK